MGRSYFLLLLLVSLLLPLSFPSGYGRKLLESVEGDEFDTSIEKDSREMYELMDYGPTGPNFNSRSALPLPDPPPSFPCQPPAPAKPIIHQP